MIHSSPSSPSLDPLVRYPHTFLYVAILMPEVATSFQRHNRNMSFSYPLFNLLYLLAKPCRNSSIDKERFFYYVGAKQTTCFKKGIKT